MALGHHPRAREVRHKFRELTMQVCKFETLSLELLRHPEATADQLNVVRVALLRIDRELEELSAEMYKQGFIPEVARYKKLKSQVRLS